MRRLAKGANVYTPGNQDSTLYFIESGQVKLVMLTPDGAECLLAILSDGDIFGELCLAGRGKRQDTATAMTAAVVRAMPCVHFLLLLTQGGLLTDFTHYLTVRLVDLQPKLWPTAAPIAQSTRHSLVLPFHQNRR